MFYHVRFELRSPTSTEELKVDLSEDDLEQRVLRPYREGVPTIINGRTIRAEDIERVKVNRSEIPTKDIIPLLKREDEDSDVVFIGGPSYEWRAANRAEDVTDELIQGPPGYAASTSKQTRKGIFSKNRGGGKRDAGVPSFPQRVREHPIAIGIGLVFVIVTGIVAFAQSSAAILNWLSPHWPLAARLADERVVETLSAGVDLSVFENELGDYTFRTADGPYVEYVFVRTSCYIQAIADRDNQVLLFAVTARNADFHPTFSPPGNDNGFVNKIELGTTTFAEWAQPDWIRGFFGASWMHYAEMIKLPHADNFLGVVVASSDAGYYFETAGGESPVGNDYPIPLNDAIAANDPSAAAIRWYREGTAINTYGEVAPGFDAADLYDSAGYPKYSIVIGPDRVRVGATAY